MTLAFHGTKNRKSLQGMELKTEKASKGIVPPGFYPLSLKSGLTDMTCQPLVKR